MHVFDQAYLPVGIKNTNRHASDVMQTYQSMFGEVILRMSNFLTPYVQLNSPLCILKLDPNSHDANELRKFVDWYRNFDIISHRTGLRLTQTKLDEMGITRSMTGLYASIQETQAITERYVKQAIHVITYEGIENIPIAPGRIMFDDQRSFWCVDVHLPNSYEDIGRRKHGICDVPSIHEYATITPTLPVCYKHAKRELGIGLYQLSTQAQSNPSAAMDRLCESLVSAYSMPHRNIKKKRGRSSPESIIAYAFSKQKKNVNEQYKRDDTTTVFRAGEQIGKGACGELLTKGEYILRYGILPCFNRYIYFFNCDEYEDIPTQAQSFFCLDQTTIKSYEAYMYPQNYFGAFTLNNERIFGINAKRVQTLCGYDVFAIRDIKHGEPIICEEERIPNLLQFSNMFTGMIPTLNEKHQALKNPPRYINAHPPPTFLAIQRLITEKRTPSLFEKMIAEPPIRKWKNDGSLVLTTNFIYKGNGFQAYIPVSTLPQDEQMTFLNNVVKNREGQFQTFWMVMNIFAYLHEAFLASPSGTEIGTQLQQHNGVSKIPESFFRTDFTLSDAVMLQYFPNQNISVMQLAQARKPNYIRQRLQEIANYERFSGRTYIPPKKHYDPDLAIINLNENEEMDQENQPMLALAQNLLIDTSPLQDLPTPPDIITPPSPVQPTNPTRLTMTSLIKPTKRGHTISWDDEEEPLPPPPKRQKKKSIQPNPQSTPSKLLHPKNPGTLISWESEPQMAPDLAQSYEELSHYNISDTNLIPQQNNTIAASPVQQVSLQQEWLNQSPHFMGEDSVSILPNMNELGGDAFSPSENTVLYRAIVNNDGHNFFDYSMEEVDPNELLFRYFGQYQYLPSKALSFQESLTLFRRQRGIRDYPKGYMVLLHLAIEKLQILLEKLHVVVPQELIQAIGMVREFVNKVTTSNNDILLASLKKQLHLVDLSHYINALNIIISSVPMELHSHVQDITNILTSFFSMLVQHQEDLYSYLDFARVEISPVYTSKDNEQLIRFQLENTSTHIHDYIQSQLRDKVEQYRGSVGVLLHNISLPPSNYHSTPANDEDVFDANVNPHLNQISTPEPPSDTAIQPLPYTLIHDPSSFTQAYDDEEQQPNQLFPGTTNQLSPALLEPELAEYYLNMDQIDLQDRLEGLPEQTNPIGIYSLEDRSDMEYIPRQDTDIYSNFGPQVPYVPPFVTPEFQLTPPPPDPFNPSF